MSSLFTGITLCNMDDVSVREFLFQIGPEFARFADKFIQHKFLNVASLRCLKIPEDISYILGDKLSLGELRQIEHCLNELKSVPKNNAESVDHQKTPVMKKICSSTEEKIKEKKKELYEAEKMVAQLDLPIKEPPPQGTMQYRCTNCHIRGHKADNNKGSTVCRNDKCTDYRECGQKEKHKEFKDDRRKAQNTIKRIKAEIAEFEEEIQRVSLYEAKSTSSFTKVVKERLKKTNPTKYSQCNVLMRDVMLLKKAYDNKIPPQSQNDKFEFNKQLKIENDKIKKEYDFDSSSSTDSPPPKKMCYVSPAQQKHNVNKYSQMHVSDYVQYPYQNPFNYMYGFPAWCPPPQPMQGADWVQHPSFFPPQQQFVPFYNNQPAPYHRSSVETSPPQQDSSDSEETEVKPKIWSPAFM